MADHTTRVGAVHRAPYSTPKRMSPVLKSKDIEGKDINISRTSPINPQKHSAFDNVQEDKDAFRLQLVHEMTRQCITFTTPGQLYLVLQDDFRSMGEEPKNVPEELPEKMEAEITTLSGTNFTEAVEVVICPVVVSFRDKLLP